MSAASTGRTRLETSDGRIPEAQPPADRTPGSGSINFSLGQTSFGQTSIRLDFFTGCAKPDIAESQSRTIVVVPGGQAHETCRVIPSATTHQRHLSRPA